MHSSVSVPPPLSSDDARTPGRRLFGGRAAKPPPPLDQGVCGPTHGSPANSDRWWKPALGNPGVNAAFGKAEHFADLDQAQHRPRPHFDASRSSHLLSPVRRRGLALRRNRSTKAVAQAGDLTKRFRSLLQQLTDRQGQAVSREPHSNVPAHSAWMPDMRHGSSTARHWSSDVSCRPRSNAPFFSECEGP